VARQSKPRHAFKTFSIIAATKLKLYHGYDESRGEAGDRSLAESGPRCTGSTSRSPGKEQGDARPSRRGTIPPAEVDPSGFGAPALISNGGAELLFVTGGGGADPMNAAASLQRYLEYSLGTKGSRFRARA